MLKNIQSFEELKNKGEFWIKIFSFWKGFLIFLLIIAFLIPFFIGYAFGSLKSDKIEVSGVSNIDSKNIDEADFASFWKAWEILSEKSADFNNVSDQDKVWGAIEGLASSLNDPYTVFLPPQESEKFTDDISGNFSGVGMEIGIRDDILTIVSPLKGTPAENAGLRPQDKILEIDGESTAGVSTDEAVNKIRGPEGTVVLLKIYREGEEDPFEVSITRGIIDIPTIDTEIIDDVFVIHLYNFGATSPNLFRSSLRDFIESGKNKMIIDLRGNPGGYMEAAIDMASWFLPAGEVVVSEDFGADKGKVDYKSKGYDIFNDNFKLAILVNGGSASASEILAGALKEHGEAILVGDKTFGKGSVQELIDVTENTFIKVTVARWLTPNGINISKEGIEPDFEVEFSLEDLKNDTDPQLQKALEELNK